MAQLRVQVSGFQRVVLFSLHLTTHHPSSSSCGYWQFKVPHHYRLRIAPVSHVGEIVRADGDNVVMVDLHRCVCVCACVRVCVNPQAYLRSQTV